MTVCGSVSVRLWYQNLPIMLRGGLSIGALLGVLRRVKKRKRMRLVVVRRVRGVKGRREARSTPGPGLVVVHRRTSEGNPGRM